MTIRKLLAPAALIPISTFIFGCIDNVQERGTEPAQTEALAASTLIHWTQICGGCGSRVAFTSVINPASYYGWALDSTYSPQPAGGYAVRRITSRGNSIMPGGLVDIDLRSNNELWGVNNAGTVFRNTYPSDDHQPWEHIVGPTAHKVATGTDKVWMLSTEYTQYGGYKLYYWSGSGSTWYSVDGPVQNGPTDLIGIDVDNNGDVWGVDGYQNVYRLPGGNPSASWEQKYFLGDAINISCGGGKVYILTNSNISGLSPIKQWSGSAFAYIQGGQRNIMVDIGGRLWASDNKNNISYYTP
jgi:virginiamycin B lyase